MPLSSTDNSPSHALFRCDGSSELGMGHVVRCLALADILHEIYGWRVSFLMRNGPLGIKEVQKRGYVVHSLNPKSEVGNFSWLKNLVSRVSGDVLICDVRDDLGRDNLNDLRQTGLLIALLDDVTGRRLAADLVFYPPIPQLEGLSWTGFSGRLYVGWEWVVLRRDVRNAQRTTVSPRPRIVVTMGGSDPFEFTIKAVCALELIDHDADAIVVLGPGFCHSRKFSEQTARLRRTIDVRSTVTNLPDLLAHADLVVGSFGTTAYEVAVMGVPGIFLCASEDHKESAKAFMNAGFGISLGLGSEVDEKTLAQTIDDELAKQVNDPLRNTGPNSGQIIDGFGAERVAEQIVMAMRERDRSYEAMAVS